MAKDYYITAEELTEIGHKENIKSCYPLNDGVHLIFKFDNGYGASVVRHRYSYGGPNGLFELAVLDSNGALDYTTPITDDVLGFLKVEEIPQLLENIKNLEKEE